MKREGAKKYNPKVETTRKNYVTHRISSLNFAEQNKVKNKD